MFVRQPVFYLLCLWTFCLALRFPLVFMLFFCLSLTGCGAKDEGFPLPACDLTVFTCQDELVYAPVVKEFRERTGKNVIVRTGSFSDLEAALAGGSFARDCDLVFGVDAGTLERYRECWEPFSCPDTAFLPEEFYGEDYRWIGFSTLPPVLLYNTKVVTYRELPENWSSLVEPRWAGRIAFVNPEISHPYATALLSAMKSSDQPDVFLARLADNLDGLVFDSPQEVYEAVADGRASIGVALEEDARRLCQQNVDMDYIYPSEGSCLVPDGSALVAGCAHPDAAREFLEFTISKDTQRILVSHLGRRSVRTDIPTPAGLGALGNLPLYILDYGEIPALRDHALELWRAHFPNSEGKRPTTPYTGWIPGADGSGRISLKQPHKT